MGELSLIKKKFFDYADSIIENGHLSHAYLIELNNYDDDYSCILSFIKMIILNDKYSSICCSDDPIIHQIDNGNYPDIKFIYPDGSFIKKNQLLELQSDFSNKSLLNGKRIYVIHQAEQLNSSSANTMLKFLEEPEDNIIAILLTDNRYHIIDTILSRCQVLSIKESIDSFVADESIYDLLSCVIHPQDFFIKYNYFISDVIVDKTISKEKFHIIETILVSYLNSKYLSISNLDETIISILKGVSQNKILNIISVIESNLVNLDYNVNYKLWLDSIFSKFIIGG